MKHRGGGAASLEWVAMNKSSGEFDCWETYTIVEINPQGKVRDRNNLSELYWGRDDL